MIERIREKYAMDVAGAGVVNPDYKEKTGVMVRLGRSQHVGKETGFGRGQGSPSKAYQVRIAEAKARYNKAVAYAKEEYEKEMKNAKEELNQSLLRNRTGDRTLKWAGTPGNKIEHLFPGSDTTLYYKKRPVGPNPKYGFVMGKNARLESANARSHSKTKLPVYR